MDFMSYLPERVYRDEEHVTDFQNAIAGETEKLLEAWESLLLQFRPFTSTWGLTIYEREYGITPDPTGPRDERLVRIRAKRLGRGTITRAVLSEVAETICGGKAEIIEHNEEYRFVVNLISPTFHNEINTLYTIINQIKPAHLNVGIVSKMELPAAYVDIRNKKHGVGTFRKTALDWELFFQGGTGETHTGITPVVQVYQRTIIN